jgi:TRAP-type transport system periplasmic protein
MFGMKRWCTSFAVLLPFLICGAAAAQNVAPGGRTFVMKLATPTLNDGQHEWMRRYAASIEAKSGGRIKAELYPASQLGSIPRMIEGTQLGSIQMFLAPPEFFVGVDQRFELMTAAGLMENDQQAIKTLTDPEFSKAFLAIGTNKGLIGVSLFFGSPSAFVMRAPLRTLGDLKGRKIRVLKAVRYLSDPVNKTEVSQMLAKASGASLDDALKTWDICMQVKAFVADGAISDEATARARDTLLASGDLNRFMGLAPR